MANRFLEPPPDRPAADCAARARCAAACQRIAAANMVPPVAAPHGDGGSVAEAPSRPAGPAVSGRYRAGPERAIIRS